MWKSFSVLIALITTQVIILATPQAPDRIIYEGKVHMLFANPLESLYDSGPKRPNFFTWPKSISSGNWRGYVATWKIEDGLLHLTQIDSWICDSADSDNCKQADLKELFGEKFKNDKIKAEWYTGELRIPEGRELRYVHLGYSSVFEKETILTVKSGEVISKRLIDNTKRVILSEMEILQEELKKMEKELKKREQKRKKN
jgi:hypothetical protein